jgi:hypothetical protein
MYNCCNSCGGTQRTCASAIEILNQIAALVCNTANGQNGQNGGCWQSCHCHCCGQQTGYYIPVSGRLYVSSNGWCTNNANVVFGTNTQTGTGTQTTTTGCTQTGGYYGGCGVGTGVYGGVTRRCGCAFNTLNF